MPINFNKSRPVARGLTVIGCLILALAVVPDWLRLGGPGWGPMQWIMVLASMVILVTATALGRIPSRWILAFLSAAGILLLVAVVAVSAKLDVPFFLWNLKLRFTGPELLGIHEHDDQLGWQHRPSRIVNTRHLDYSATYTIGADRMRPTGSKSRPDRRVIFIGGSFTFGHGVNDTEAFPAVLARDHWPDHEVVNAAVNGWGTVQSYLRLKQLLGNSETPPKLVVYGWISHHSHRNSDRLTSLATERKRPIVKIVDGTPVFDRLIDATDGQPDSDELDRREYAASIKLLESMEQLCFAHGTKLVCLVSAVKLR